MYQCTTPIYLHWLNKWEKKKKLFGLKKQAVLWTRMALKLAWKKYMCALFFKSVCLCVKQFLLKYFICVLVFLSFFLVQNYFFSFQVICAEKGWTVQGCHIFIQIYENLNFTKLICKAISKNVSYSFLFYNHNAVGILLIGTFVIYRSIVLRFLKMRPLQKLQLKIQCE